MCAHVRLCLAILAGMFLGVYTPMCVHTLGYAQLRMMDNQNIDDGIGIAAHSSLTRSARWVVQDWQGPPRCQLYRLAPSSHSTVYGLHLMVQRTASAL